MKIKAVIWDVGGVLMRTEDYSSREQLAKRLGYSRQELEDLVFGMESGRRAQLGEIPLEQHWENVLQSLGLSSEALSDFQNGFWAGDYLDTGLIDYIRSLRGNYKIGLLSNAFSDLRNLATNVWKIADAFDQMIISAEVGLMKPDARIYQLAVQRLGVQPAEAVFIDDFLHNVEGARAEHLQSIHFKTPSQVKEALSMMISDGAGNHA